MHLLYFRCVFVWSTWFFSILPYFVFLSLAMRLLSEKLQFQNQNQSCSGLLLNMLGKDSSILKKIYMNKAGYASHPPLIFPFFGIKKFISNSIYQNFYYQILNHQHNQSRFEDSLQNYFFNIFTQTRVVESCSDWCCTFSSRGSSHCIWTWPAEDRSDPGQNWHSQNCAHPGWLTSPGHCCHQGM